MNCRSVSAPTWEHARQALVFFFTRRCGLADAEDLAHQTLAAVLSREDYHFEKEEDFLRICYAFGNRVMQAARRDTKKHSGGEIDGDVPARRSETNGLEDAEVQVYLNEVLRLGKEKLRDADWQLIRQSLVVGEPATVVPESGAGRVKLHRARRRLVDLAGWGKPRV